jgi:biopolymer transport protein TolQ
MTFGLWQILSSTDLMTKGVLLGLLAMSVLTWALALYKKMVFSAKLKSLKQAQGLLQNVKGMDDFLARTSVIQNTFAGELIGTFLTEFKKMLRIYDAGGTTIADKDWYLLQATIAQRVDEALAEEEHLIPILSTNAQAAPLVGLFGTVWGLIHAFMGIAQQRSADISAVAPGIAEALVTTLGGLIVAIPALVLYSYLVGQMRVLERSIIEISETCLWIMRNVLHSDAGKAQYVGKPAHPLTDMTSVSAPWSKE